MEVDGRKGLSLLCLCVLLKLTLINCEEILCSGSSCLYAHEELFTFVVWYRTSAKLEYFRQRVGLITIYGHAKSESNQTLTNKGFVVPGSDGPQGQTVRITVCPQQYLGDATATTSKDYPMRITIHQLEPNRKPSI